MDKDLPAAEPAENGQSVVPPDLATILRGIPDAVLVVNLDGQAMHFNPAAERILGKTILMEDALCWTGEFRIFSSDGETEYPSERIPLKRALRGEPVDSEDLLLRSDKGHDPRWLRLTARPLLDSSGEISGAVAIFTDITDHRRLEDLHRSKENHSAVLSRLSRSIVEAGPNLKLIASIVAEQTSESLGDACLISLVNPENQRLAIAAVAHWDKTSAGLLNTTARSLEYEPGQGFLGSAVTSGEPLIIPSIAPEHVAAVMPPEFGPYMEKNGLRGIMIAPLKSDKRVLGTLSVLRDQNGSPYTQDDQSLLLDIGHITTMAVINAQLVQTVQDELQQRRETERALRESEQLFRTIFSDSPLGIKILDSEGRILQTNRALQAMLGFQAEEIQGKRFSVFTHPLDLPQSERSFESLVSGKTSRYALQKRYLTSTGATVWAHIYFNSVRDSRGNLSFVISLVEDVTERMEMETELAELRSRMLDSAERERLRLAQDLHDGPMQDLHSINFMIKALAGQVDEEPAAALDGISDSVIGVLQTLRATAKELRPPSIMDFGLSNALRSHIDDLRERHPELQFKLALTEDQGLLPERVRLALFRITQQALMNTIRHAQAKQVSIRFTVDLEEIALEIEDDGVGFAVPPRWISLVRQGHYGLAGAAERVEALAGQFTVDSRPGAGTRLRVRLPRPLEMEERPADGQAAEE